MVDERSSPSKGWQEVNTIMTEGGLSETDEIIMFHQAQSGDAPSYEGDTENDDAQTDVTQYSDSRRYDAL